MKAIYIIGAILILVLMYYSSESWERCLTKFELKALKIYTIVSLISMIVTLIYCL